MKFTKKQLKEAANYFANNYQYPNLQSDELKAAKRVVAIRFYQTLINLKLDSKHDRLKICKNNPAFASLISELSQLNFMYPESKYYNLEVQNKRNRKTFFSESSHFFKSQVKDYYQAKNDEEKYEKNAEPEESSYNSSEESTESSDSFESKRYDFLKEAYEYDESEVFEKLVKPLLSENTLSNSIDENESELFQHSL